MQSKAEIMSTRDAVVAAIEKNAWTLNMIFLLIIFTLLLVVVRFIYSILNYIPINSVLTMLSIVAALMVIAIFLIQSTSQKGVKALNRYVEELDELMTAKYENEKKYASLFHQSNDGIFIEDLEGNILEANLKMMEMFGATEQELLSGNALELHPPEASVQAAGALKDIITEGHLRYEIKFRKRSGATFPAEVSSSLIEAGGKKVIQSIVRDITGRKELEAKLRCHSITDELTGLLNRRGFVTMAKQQLKIADRSGRGMFLMYADMDGLKEINDTLGHHEGDRAILEIASLFKKNVRESDVVARFGGDEFVALMVDVSEAADESIITERMLKRLEALNQANKGRSYRLSMSLGLAYYDPQDNCSLEDLLVRADAAMYDNKKSRAA
jgi:diguanylate cyclase (GGDEF)-like protein/PAS domain S-box-containing protein